MESACELRGLLLDLGDMADSVGRDDAPLSFYRFVYGEVVRLAEDAGRIARTLLADLGPADGDDGASGGGR